MNNRLILILICLAFLCEHSYSQKKDSVIIKNDSIHSSIKAPSDTVPKKKVFNPRTAALRSAILPGLGQIYNKKYWKLPLVYGALGATAYVFNFNLTQYKRVEYAYRLLINKDTANYKNVDADLQPFIKANASNDLRNYRNSYRKDIDYSVLIFLLFWGLNVVDATVDAHLKGFNVNDNLTLKIKPGYSPIANTTGASLALDIHKSKRAILTLPD